MKLEWIDKIISEEGESKHLHYLVDRVTDRCYATIREPHGGGILYGTDLKFDCDDRWYISLEGAKAYCVFAATVEDAIDAEELLEHIESEHHDMICEDCRREAEEEASRAIPHQHKN